MSTDLRNSIQAWVWALAYFGLFWLAVHFELFAGIGSSNGWLFGAFTILTLINLLRFAWWLWRRRDASPDNSTHI